MANYGYTYTARYTLSTSDTSSGMNDGWSSYKLGGKVFKAVDDFQIYDSCNPKKAGMNEKKSGPDFDKRYEEIRDKEIVKLLESMGKPPEGFVTPIILLVPYGKEDKGVGSSMDALTIQKKHPTVIQVFTLTDKGLKDIKKLEHAILKNFVSTAFYDKLIPIVVMLDVFNKDQNTMEQSLLMKTGSFLLETFQKVLSKMEHGSKPEFKPDPLIVISDSMTLDDMEEAATLVGVTEMEEVKEDNLSYMKLTF